MLKKVLCAAVGSAIAVCAYAESNVTFRYSGYSDKAQESERQSHDGRRYLRRKPLRL